jgi:hypothetical protein
MNPDRTYSCFHNEMVGVVPLLTAGGAPACNADLCHKEIHDTFERIKAKGSGYWRSQVGVGVDVVENKPAVVGLKILDSAHVQAAGLH